MLVRNIYCPEWQWNLCIKKLKKISKRFFRRKNWWTLHLLRWFVHVWTAKIRPWMRKTTFQHMVYAEKYIFAKVVSSSWFISISGKCAHWRLISSLEEKNARQVVCLLTLPPLCFAYFIFVFHAVAILEKQAFLEVAWGEVQQYRCCKLRSNCSLPASSKVAQTTRGTEYSM